MELQRLFSLLLLAFVTLAQEASAVCDEGWERFDEKCLIVTDLFLNKEEAEAHCAELALPGNDSYVPTLLTIKSIQEQGMFQEWFFTDLDIVDSAWLGAERYNQTVFRWDDRSPFMYTNWRPDRPTEDLANSCVEISPRNTKLEVNNEDGEWTDVACNKRNVVVCQQPLAITFQELHEMVLEIKHNPVPIGFIYVQLPDQPSPVTLWPSLIWKNVTDEYAGLFFRAGGGESAGFGDIQEESSPNLENVYFMLSENINRPPDSIDVPKNGSESVFVSAGVSSNDIAGYEGLSFKLSAVENRPRNTAVIVWRRL